MMDGYAQDMGRVKKIISYPTEYTYRNFIFKYRGGNRKMTIKFNAYY